MQVLRNVVARSGARSARFLTKPLAPQFARFQSTIVIPRSDESFREMEAKKITDVKANIDRIMALSDHEDEKKELILKNGNIDK